MAQAENLDSRLLRSQAEEQAAAREIKEKKRGQAGEADEEEAGADGQPRSLRQKVQAARQALNLKEQAKKKLEEKVLSPAKAGTSHALQWAWKVLIPSWGLSLVYINIHVFLKYVFGEKLFCKLGEEWLPKQATEAVGEAGNTVNKSIGLVEIMVLLILDLIFLSVVLGVLALLALIVSWATNPWEGLKAIWSMGWGAIKALVNLFSGLFVDLIK